MNGQVPMLVLNTNTAVENQKNKTVLSNIQAATAVASILSSVLGPSSMLKMILDPVGGINMTNDGNAILREIDVAHPAAKNMIELARTQDEEIGDGTTSVILLTAELLRNAEPLIMKNFHPRVIIQAYYKALDAALNLLEKNAISLDTNNQALLLKIVNTTLGTKFTSRFGDLVSNLAIKAVQCVSTVNDGGQREIDIKRYARVEKIPGDYIENSMVLDGILLNKDVVDAKMRRRIENPRIVLLDSNLEYKKSESMTNIEITKEEDWDLILRQEEEYIEQLCNSIIAVKPDLVLTEKGVSELAAHYLYKAGITVLRRVRKTDNNRIARAVGAAIVHDPRELKPSDVGTGCGLFEVKKIGDEYFTYIVECKDPKACTILLRGASKDVLQEIDRNLQDAMAVVRNILIDPRVLPGGGAIDMAIASALHKLAKVELGDHQEPFKSAARAFDIIPRILCENAGAKTIRVMTELRVKHQTEGNCSWGLNGLTGDLVEYDINGSGENFVFEGLSTKRQIISTAFESACLTLRIDSIVSGQRSDGTKQEQQREREKDEEADDEGKNTFGNAMDG